MRNKNFNLLYGIRHWRIVIVLGSMMLVSLPDVHAQTQTKVADLVRIQGIRQNALVGYGLVVGLNGTGDSKRFTMSRAMLQNLIRSFGNNVDLGKSEMRNTAAVMVSAQLPSFASHGDKVDVTVASIGDARSLQGGLLVQTPLYGPNKKMIGLAQGPVFVQKQTRSRPAKNIGIVANGGIIEQDLRPDIAPQKDGKHIVVLRLKEPGFMRAQIIFKAIQKKIAGTNFINANVLDSSRIRLEINPGQVNQMVSQIMDLTITVPEMARVVIDERRGVVVLGNQVKIAPVAISVQGLVLAKKGKDEDLMALYRNDTQKKGQAFFYLKQSASVEDVVKKMNELGASTSDLIALFKAIHAAGALHGDLIVQ